MSRPWRSPDFGLSGGGSTVLKYAAMSDTHLRADCANCFGLCCAAMRFEASASFAIDKPAGTPCPNLLVDFRCGIHQNLRAEGFSGCTVWDCFGAGQHMSQGTFGGRDWRSNPELAEPMFKAFPVMRRLHQIRWYLTEALSLETSRPLYTELRTRLDETEQLTNGSAEDLLAVDLARQKLTIDLLLGEVSALARAGVENRKKHHRADLMGAKLCGADLRGADLRYANLVAADLTGADLRLADFLGADLHDARLAGANLASALFLTQTQLNSTIGDARTLLPASLERPPHWS
jgi:uncharacterized protein YjbI with pentapeptide repeats